MTTSLVATAATMSILVGLATVQQLLLLLQAVALAAARQPVLQRLANRQQLNLTPQLLFCTYPSAHYPYTLYQTGLLTCT